MNIRLRRAMMQPQPLVSPIPVEPLEPVRLQQPRYPLLEPELRTMPSVAELAAIIVSRVERLSPGVDEEAIRRAAQHGAEVVVTSTTPRVFAYLPELGVREACARLAQDLSLEHQSQLRAVA